MNEPRPDPRVGLCSLCVHTRLVRSGKGATFWLCDRSREEPEAYRRYPALPVHTCPGFDATSTATGRE